jgi:hypothetical protein
MQRPDGTLLETIKALVSRRQRRVPMKTFKSAGSDLNGVTAIAQIDVHLLVVGMSWALRKGRQWTQTSKERLEWMVQK